MTVVLCPECGSQDTEQPMQTLDMPMIRECQACEYRAPSREFNDD